MTQKNKTSAYSSLTGIHRAVPIILFAIAVFTMFCFITQDIGALGHTISTILLGLFSYGAYAIPLLLALHAIFYPSDITENRLVSRVVFSLVAITFISALAYAITYWSTDLVFSPIQFFKNGQNSQGGGFIGGIVGFCLVKIFGRIGLVIIATAIFAIYITYFFATGQRKISKFFFNVIKAIVIILAYAEMGIKTFFKKIKNAKSDKLRREAEEKNGKLTDDDFFAVDNGMKKLSVSELGIKEMREDATADGNALLHEKIFYKSAVSPEEAAEMEMREKAEEFFYAEMERRSKEEEDAAPMPRRRLVNVTYDDPDSNIGKTVKEEAPKEDVVVSRPVVITDDNADAVFTQDFDPFGMMMSEELASKPSSRSLKDEAPRNVRTRKVTEDISELTEEDIEREKRVLEFERRKAAILGARNAIPVDNDGEFTGTPKNVAFRERTNEKTGDDPMETTSSSFIFDKVEKTVEPPKAIPANYTSIGFGSEEVRVNDALSTPEFTAPETIYSYEPPKEAPKQVNYTTNDTPKNDTAPAPLPYIEEDSVTLFEKKTTIEFTPAYSPVVEATPVITETAPIIEEDSVPLFERKATLEFTPAQSPVTEAAPTINEVAPIVTENAPIVEENSTHIFEMATPEVEPEHTPVAETTPVVTPGISIVEEHTAPLFEENPVIQVTPAYSPMSDTIPVITVSAPAPEEKEADQAPAYTMSAEPEATKTEEFSYTATKDFEKEDNEEYVPEFKPYQVVTPEEASEPVVEAPEFKDEAPEEVNTLTIEREYVGDERTEEESFFQGSDESEDYFGTNDGDEEIDDLPDDVENIDPEEEESSFETSEIPPEERNPVVQEFLNMFPALHDDKAEDEETEDCSGDYELTSPDEIEDETGDDGDIDLSDGKDDDDIPPFEHSSIRPESKAKVEKKEEAPVKKKPDFSNYQMPTLD